MESQSLILGGIIAALTLLILAWPFVAGSRNGEQPMSSALETLVARRDAIYATIRDLDFDFETGKLAEDDYLAQREVWVLRGIDVLKAIDAYQQETGESIPAPGTLYAAPLEETTDLSAAFDEELEAEIEAAIAARATASRRRTG